MRISIDNLVEVKVKTSIQAELVDAFNNTNDHYGVNTVVRIAHFMAQLCYESAGFRITVENLNYKTPKRLMQIWPKRFPTIDFAREFINDPEKLGNYVYANRLGNGGPETNEGYRFRGRGPLQTTGKDWYKFISRKIFGDERLLEDPDMLSQINFGLLAAFIEWEKSACNLLADNDDVRKITKKINGAYTGLQGRSEWVLRWKIALKDNKH